MQRDQARRDVTNARRRQLREEDAAATDATGDPVAAIDPAEAVIAVNGNGHPPRPATPAVVVMAEFEDQDEVDATGALNNVQSLKFNLTERT